MNTVHPGSVKIIDEFAENCINCSSAILSLAIQIYCYNIKILKITLKYSVSGTFCSQVCIIVYNQLYRPYEDISGK